MSNIYFEISCHESLQIINQEIQLFNLLDDNDDKSCCSENIALHCRILIDYLLKIKQEYPNNRELCRYISTLINKCISDYDTYSRNYEENSLSDMFQNCNF